MYGSRERARHVAPGSVSSRLNSYAVAHLWCMILTHPPIQPHPLHLVFPCVLFPLVCIQNRTDSELAINGINAAKAARVGHLTLQSIPTAEVVSTLFGTQVRAWLG